MHRSGIERLILVAPLMQKRRPAPNATLSYEILADALVWSDELPGQADWSTIDDGSTRLLALTVPHEQFPVPQRILDVSCIRPVLYYRSSLVIGEPDCYAEDYWAEAYRLFPDWAGFEPRRRSRDLEATLKEFRRAAQAEYAELLASFEDETQ